MSDELNEVLDDQPTTAEATEQPEAGQPTDQPDAETDAETGEQDAAPPAAGDQPKTVPLAALEDERSKRQELERSIALQQQQLQQMQAQFQQAQQPPEKQPGFYEDPDAALKRHTQQLQQQQLDNYVNTTVAVAKQMHPDYGDALAEFQGAVRQNPGLYQAAVTSENPGEFVYQHYQQQKALKAAQAAPDVSALQAKLDAQANELELLRGAGSVPKSLAGQRSTGSNSSSKPWSGPDSLEDILSG